MTNRTKASPVSLSLGTAAILGTCSNFHPPLPAFSFTHPLSHSAGRSQWHICTIHAVHHSFSLDSQLCFQWLDQTWPYFIRLQLYFNGTCWNLADEAFACKVMFCGAAQRQWLGRLLSGALFSDPDTHGDAQRCSQTDKCKPAWA